MNYILDLQKIKDKLGELKKSSPLWLKKLKENAQNVGKAWCGSWLGYQSRIYYKDLSPVPPGAHFSVEWGVKNRIANETTGEWYEYSYDDVVDEIYSRTNVSEDDIKKQTDFCHRIEKQIDISKRETKSIVVCISAMAEDAVLSEIMSDIMNSKIRYKEDFISACLPRGGIMSRDTIAMSEGVKTPPHLDVLAWICEVESFYSVVDNIVTLLEQMTAHFSRISRKTVTMKQGDCIFIGHGRSLQWLQLKDFIKDKLQLSYEEFNRVPVAGITNIARLENMLNNAMFAFLIMTAEDELSNGNMQARMNVVHEVGLFQGKLGFDKAIVLLEEGCEEFSNIQGLGQIRFNKGNISSCFEEIRELLEYHNIIHS